MHALRHFYASVLLDGGESIKAVSQYLGHADPALTLRVYAHLMPSSQERTRRAIDQAFNAGSCEAEGAATLWRLPPLPGAAPVSHHRGTLLNS